MRRVTRGWQQHVGAQLAIENVHRGRVASAATQVRQRRLGKLRARIRGGHRDDRTQQRGSDRDCRPRFSCRNDVQEAPRGRVRGWRKRELAASGRGREDNAPERNRRVAHDDRVAQDRAVARPSWHETSRPSRRRASARPLRCRHRAPASWSTTPRADIATDAAADSATDGGCLERSGIARRSAPDAQAAREITRSARAKSAAHEDARSRARCDSATRPARRRDEGRHGALACQGFKVADDSSSPQECKRGFVAVPDHGPRVKTTVVAASSSAGQTAQLRSAPPQPWQRMTRD